MDTLKDNNFFDENLKRYETNADTGYIIEIDKGSIKETFNRDNFVRIPRVFKEIKLATIDKIPDIIKYGEVVEDNVKVTDNNKSRTFLYIKHPVEVDGKEHTIYVTIQKTSARNHFYVHSVDLNVNKIGLGASGADTETASALSELPSPNVRIPQVQKNDNGNNLSQNGGTQSSFVVPKVSNDSTSDRDNLSIREKIEAAANSGVTAKSRNVQTKAENTLIKTISNAFGVKNNDKQGIIKEMVKEISQQVKETGTVKAEDINRLADAAFEKGVISSNELVKQYPKLKAERRDSRIKYQSSEVFQNMRNEYFGKLRFAKGGTDVDIVYQQFNEKYPDMFPEDITNPEDQVVRLGQIYDSLAENEQSLADYYGDSSEEMKTSAALTNAATTVAEELPFVSGLVGGGRVPISSALPDAAEVVKLLDADVSAEKKKNIAAKELTKPLWYLAAPTAGGQAKKAAEAAALYFLNGGVEYGVESDGDKKAKFAVDTNNVLKAGQTALFGKWSSKEAREYIDNNFKGLTVGQTENFEIFKSWGMSNSEAFAKAKGTSDMTDKQLETLQQLQEAGMKNSTAYEMATTARKEADTDGNNSIKIAEAKAYLNSKNFTREQKAVLFSCMCPGVKNNPYE